MRNRSARAGEVASPAGYGERPPKLADFNVKKRATAGHSVKQLVRSLSDRYAAVTSPLTCKRKTSCSSRTPSSLKLMKTTAATSVLPLRPAVSASCKKLTRTPSLAESLAANKKETLTLAEAPANKTPAETIAKRLLDLQILTLRESPAAKTPAEIVTKRFQAEAQGLGKLTIKAPSSRAEGSTIAPSLRLQSLYLRDKKMGAALKQLPERSSGKAFFVERLASHQRQGRRLSQVLASDSMDRTKPEWQQLETLFKLKDEELESIRTAGLMLKELCMKQDEEIKMLKAAFPATLEEMAQLREACGKQEEELAQSRVAIPAMQAQVSALAEQLRVLTEDLAQLKACKEASSERVSSQLHEREASNSSGSSTLSVEPFPLTSGYMDHLRRSRRGLHVSSPSEEKLLPAGICEAPSSSCSSATMSVHQSSEVPSESKAIQGRHRRGFSAVLSTEHMLKGSGRRSGRSLMTDKEIADTLQELSNAADKEQAMLQERCANVFKDLRSSSSRFASLEPLKSILTCTSPHFYKDALENEGIDISAKPGKVAAASVWNLKPT